MKRQTRRAFSAGLGALVLAACGGPPAKSANPQRSLDERRAVQIIAQAFRDEHDNPVPGRAVALGEGRSIEVDVIGEGKQYGVAYVTGNERQSLTGALPPKSPELGDALQLINGSGQDASMKILVLHDTDYRYDDQVGTAHEETTITAERKLARDVRDFLVRAHAERW